MEEVIIVNKYGTAIGVLTFLFLFVFAGFSAAETKVTLIEVQGNKRIETSTILAKIKTREGDVFSPAMIRKTSRRCTSSGILRTCR